MNLRRVMVAAVLLAASGGAFAYVRETTVNGDPGAGTCLWWGQRGLSYRVNATSAGNTLTNIWPNSTPCLDANAAAALVASTLPAWNNAKRSGAALACTDLALSAGATTTQTAMGNDGINLVVFRAGWCSSTFVVPAGDACRSTLGACAAKYNCWEHDSTGTIGLTTLTYNTTTGEIVDADIEFHGRDFSGANTGYWMTCASSSSCGGAPWNPPVQTNCISTDVGSLALHEAGHVLGLDHTCQYAAPYNSCPTSGTSVMQPTIPSGQTRRTLDPDDVEGICTIYPAGAATLTCPPVSTPPHSSGGCNSAEGAGALSLLGVLLAAFRTRRRRS